MEGKISFSGPAPGPLDPLCTDLTAYVKVSYVFKLSVTKNPTFSSLYGHHVQLKLYKTTSKHLLFMIDFFKSNLTSDVLF